MRKKDNIMRFTWLGMSLAASMLLGAAEPENLLQNGDFEEGLAHWQVPTWFKNALVPEADGAVNQGAGANSLKITGKNTQLGYIIQQIVMPSGISKLRIAGWMKTQGFQNSWTARIQVEFFDAGGKKVGPGFPLITPSRNSDTDWTQYQREIVPPEGAQYCRVILLTHYPIRPVPNAGIVWYDNLSLTAITPQVAQTPVNLQ